MDPSANCPDNPEHRHYSSSKWRAWIGDLATAAGLGLLLVHLVTTPAFRPEDRHIVPRSNPVERFSSAAESIAMGAAVPRINLLVDLSASMAETLPDISTLGSKWVLVQMGIAEFLKELPRAAVVGVRVFGWNSSACAPSQLLRAPAPLGDDGAAEIIRSLQNFYPSGDTPLARSLIPAAEDLGVAGGQVILLSDGMDSCGTLNQLCDTARTIARRGVPVRIDLVRAFIPKDAGRALECVPEATGGLALDFIGADPSALAAMLRAALPLRIAVALFVIASGALTFFALCELLAEALGGLRMMWARAGFIADLAFAAATTGWSLFWLRHQGHVPVLVAVMLVAGALLVLFREVPRRRRAADPVW